MRDSIGIIFDFDGVVVLSEPVHQRAWIDVGMELGRSLPEGFIDRGIGRSDGELATELALFWQDEIAGDEVLAIKRRCYQARCVRETEFVPGSPEAIRKFSTEHPVALATSSSIGDISHHLEHHGLRSHFRAVLTIESVNRPKPDPEIYLKAADEMRVDPRNCWVFEDSIPGATAAHAAGMRVIGLTTTHPPDALELALLRIANFSELDSLWSRVTQ